MNLELNVFETHGQVSPTPRVHYIQHEFEVPQGLGTLNVTLRYRKERLCQLFLSIFGPNGYRGTRMMPGATGDIVLELEFGVGHASFGAIPGSLEPGTWRVQIDVERTEETANYALTVAGSREARASSPTLTPASANGRANGRTGAGWYRGELHSHSTHSDGKTSVSGVLEAARKFGLDFISLTDHFTHAGWHEADSLSSEDLCVIHGIELTGHAGHANLHGLSEWVNTFVDEPGSEWNIGSVAQAARAQGGLFCVNHPFSLTLGWRYHALEWSAVDALEIYHHLEGPNNTAQLGLWDGLLRAGQRITGVAGTDSHDAFSGRHRLGHVFSVVYADSLSPAAILEGVRAGRTYVSLGPTLEFRAFSGDNEATMGQTLDSPGEVRLEVTLEKLDYPARVIVLKNGLYHAHKDIPAAREVTALEFFDDAPIPGYYRLEVFAREAQPTNFTGRDWNNTLLLSNPIFVA